MRAVNIDKVLKDLGIEEVNQGVSTGVEWFDTEGAITNSVSPVDGKEIASVKNATMDDYEMVIKKHRPLLKSGDLFPLLNVARLFVR